MSDSIRSVIVFASLISLCKSQQNLCPDKNGRYATAQCDAYLECSGGKGEYKLCPDGLLFNEKSPFFSYPCQYPHEVSCEGRNAVQPPQPTESCPNQYAYYKLGDASHCGQFVRCVNGEAFVFDCPEGLAFSEATYRCEWPDEVASCDAESYLQFSCPTNSDEFSLHADPRSCSKFFACVKGRPRLHNCGQGKAFNQERGVCEDVSKVPRCSENPSLSDFRYTQS